MTTQNRKTRNPGLSGAAAFLLLFAASVMLAISANGKPGFDAVIGGIQTGRASSSCLRFPSRYETAGPVDVVSPGESLAIAIRDSHVVASDLLERYLWRFPPGSQCEIDDEDGDVFRGSRF